MNDEPGRRAPPQTTVQAAGQAASDVINGLRQQPILLGLVVLNVLGIGSAAWFLGKLSEGQTARMDKLLEIVRACLRLAPGGQS